MTPGAVFRKVYFFPKIIKNLTICSFQKRTCVIILTKLIHKMGFSGELHTTGGFPVPKYRRKSVHEKENQ